MLQSIQGANVPGSESTTYGTFAPEIGNMWERKFHNSYQLNWLLWLPIYS